MSTKNFLQDLAIEQAPKQAHLVNAIVEDSPILATMPMVPASNGIQNVYEELQDVQGAQVVDLDSELPLIDANGKLKYQDLSVLGGQMSVGEDKANKLGGPAKYFDNKLVPVLEITGNNVEKSWIASIYDWAKTAGKQTLQGSVTADINYSIIALTWKTGEVEGLYDQTGLGNGKVFDMKALNNGALMDIDDGKGNTIPGYKMRIKNYLGWKLLNGERNVATIRNIDLTKNAGNPNGYEFLPSETEIDELLDSVRRSKKNTRLYMRPEVLTALNVYKGGALQMSPTEMDLDRTIDNWNGVAIVTSYNFSKTEALATA